ncbi:hypothetical protein K502DRAFT_366938 [Neoconidiobolus thromboides FSU 785]|nr:hypothetical protein K502DRAFT_366938 [Neoconidiobolus thromboides FSU 785]
MDPQLIKEIEALKEELQLIQHKKKVLTHLIDEEVSHIENQHLMKPNQIDLRRIQQLKEHQTQLKQYEPKLTSYRLSGRSFFLLQDLKLLGYRIDTFNNYCFSNIYYLFFDFSLSKILHHTLPEELDIDLIKLQSDYLPNDLDSLLTYIHTLLDTYISEKSK